MPIRGLGHVPSPFKKKNMKKFLKIIAVAQAGAFPAIETPVQKADTLENTLEATNILYQNSIVDSLFVTYPKNTIDIYKACGYTALIQLSPVSNLELVFGFLCGKDYEDYPDNPYNGLAIIAYSGEAWDTLNNYLDTSNLKYFSLVGDDNRGIFFGDCKMCPQNYINQNVIINFKEPVLVRVVAPGIEKYVFSPKPVDKYALTYNSLLNGYSYNMLGGREDIDPAFAYEYIKNHAQKITDPQDWWAGFTMFRVATFKNGSETFDIVGIVSGPGDVGLFTNYKAGNTAHLKELVDYQKEADNSYSIFATHQISIGGYYACTIVDETASRFVLTSGADFSSFLDYAKSVGYPEGYAQGVTDGQNNPTFKSFIVSAFEACSAFFSLPVLGQNITVGTLIGSFIGLGALFLLIRLFR